MEKPGDVNPFAPIDSPAREGQVEVRRQASATANCATPAFAKSSDQAVGVPVAGDDSSS